VNEAIADFRLPIADWKIFGNWEEIGNRQSEIGN